jgi:hypothetical protein
MFIGVSSKLLMNRTFVLNLANNCSMPLEFTWVELDTVARRWDLLLLYSCALLTITKKIVSRGVQIGKQSHMQSLKKWAERNTYMFLVTHKFLPTFLCGTMSGISRFLEPRT